MLFTVVPLADRKAPAAYMSVPSIAIASTVTPGASSIPLPSVDQVLPSHFAMWFAGAPPALVKWPPAYRLLPSTARECTALSVPVPRADQALPFHLAILFAGA